MPKLINLTTTKTPPEFRIPKWLKPGMIMDLMQGTISDSEDDDMVHVEMVDSKTDGADKK